MSAKFRSCKISALTFFSGFFQDKPQNCNDVVLDENIKEGSSKTGFDRVVDLFMLDEFGSPSKELLSTWHTACFSGFLGGSFAGLKESQIKFQNFVTTFNSDMFVSHTEAKSALTQKMAVSFFKSFTHWGLRMAFFSALFTLNVNMLGAYSNQMSLWHFICSGIVTGSVYRIPLGLRAMVVAGTVGGSLGLCAGCMSMGLLKMFGTSYDEIQEWHYKVRNLREEVSLEAADLVERNYQSNQLLNDRAAILKSAALEASLDTKSENPQVASSSK